MQTDPLTSLGYRLDGRTNRPEIFRPTQAWETPRFSFQLDTDQGVGRRISRDANPDTYFTVQSLVPARPHFVRPPRPSRRLIRSGLATVAVAAILLVLYPLYPAAQYHVQRSVAETVSHTTALAAAPVTVSEANRIVIPKIGVKANILEGTNLSVLNHADGVWHETGTETNNLVLAGHRFKYLPPNTTTLYNLDKVQVGDTIVVDWYHKRYIYVVDGTKIVTKHDIGIRNATATPTLTIYSCEEANQAHRIVVTAHRLD